MSGDKPSEAVIEAACAPLMDNDHVRNFVYSEWDDGAEVGALAEKILTHVWPIVVREVRLAGWVPFGTHVDCLDLQLEFSALGEDGLPEWERVSSVAAGLVGEPEQPERCAHSRPLMTRPHDCPFVVCSCVMGGQPNCSIASTLAAETPDEQR